MIAPCRVVEGRLETPTGARNENNTLPPFFFVQKNKGEGLGIECPTSKTRDYRQKKSQIWLYFLLLNIFGCAAVHMIIIFLVCMCLISYYSLRNEFHLISEMLKFGCNEILR